MEFPLYDENNVPEGSLGGRASYSNYRYLCALISHYQTVSLKWETYLFVLKADMPIISIAPLKA